MKYKIQCPYCGSDDLLFDARLEIFYCLSCHDDFEIELIGIRKMEDKVDTIKQLEEWCKENNYHTRKGKNIIEIRNNKKSKITIRFLSDIRNIGVIEFSSLLLELKNFFEEDK